MNSTGEIFNIESLQDLLKQTFSENCERHYGKNDAYCFDCKLRLCWYCTVNDSTHTSHNHIAIHRHMAQNSLTTADIQRFNLIDVWDIKDYQSGGKRLVLLHANQKSSRAHARVHKCQNCHARLFELNVSYCSLACKVSKTYPETEIGSSVQTGSTPDQPIDLTKENSDPTISVPKRRKMSS